MPSADFERLLAGYLDGDLAEVDRERLATEVERDAEAARQFDEALRVEALLTAGCRAAAPVAVVPITANVVRGPWSRLRWAAAAAAIVALGVAGILWARKPVTLTGPVTKQLADGSRVELAPEGKAVARGRTVTLQTGSGTFHVVKGRGPFLVLTPVGTITVLGTQFRVELQPEHTTEGAEMKGTTVLAMTVAVMAGSVQVDVGGRSYTLGVGQSMVFAEEQKAPAEPKPARVKEGERKDNTTRFGGAIAVVTGNSLTVTIGGGDNKPSREETVTLNADTKVRVETDEMVEVAGEGGAMKQRPKTVDGNIADLKAGQRVYVRAKDGVATDIVVPRVAPKREGGEGGRKEPAPAPQPRRGEGER